MTQISNDMPKINYQAPIAVAPLNKLPKYEAPNILATGSVLYDIPQKDVFLDSAADVVAGSGVTLWCLGVGAGAIWGTPKLVRLCRRIKPYITRSFLKNTKSPTV